MRRETIDPSLLEEAKRCALEISEGGSILYPAETLWGLGCIAEDIKSVERIKEIKKRPDNKSLITLVSSYRMLQNVVSQIPSMAEEIIEMSDDAVTIIYPAANTKFQHLCSEDGKIGVRLVEKGFPNYLIEKTRKPLISTSANISGQTTSGSFNDIPDEIINQVDCIANPDLPYEMTGKSSKVILIEMDGRVKILR